MCWIHFQNIHTFTYQKTLLHTLFCLFLKLPKAFSVSLNLVKVQLCLYRNNSRRSTTKPWYDKRISRFLSILIHLWTVGIPVSLLNFKLKSCTLLSSLLKVKFSGEYCSHIESKSTILSAAWNKRHSSTPIFRFLVDFRGIVGVLKGTLLQIWKSPYIFVFTSKQYPKSFLFLVRRIIELFARKVCKIS